MALTSHDHVKTNKGTNEVHVELRYSLHTSITHEIESDSIDYISGHNMNQLP